MTDSDANTDRVEGDAESPPDPRCVAVADGTGERCRNRAIPGSDRCHAHVDYADLADPPEDTHEERTREETPPGVWP